ncbi:unnamed protein product [Danaus chrysippus]|uniref:(African queen) hypothetical protein n=1 Tax=Danaus chrysippus TaxID=151541 RepID=A0A8J2R8T6_9NEOP|nr:unnamed protein product [Danaus chrysippus]
MADKREVCYTDYRDAACHQLSDFRYRTGGSVEGRGSRVEGRGSRFSVSLYHAIFINEDCHQSRESVKSAASGTCSERRVPASTTMELNTEGTTRRGKSSRRNEYITF